MPSTTGMSLCLRMSENGAMVESRANTERGAAIGAIVLVSIAAGCGGSLGAQGGERQPCHPNRTCNPGLTCASDVCVDLGGGGTGGTAGSRGGAAGVIGTAGTSGRGGVAGQGGSFECGSADRPSSLLPADILIVQDASGSMNQDTNNQTCANAGCGATSKWALMTPAINEVVFQTQTTVNWGLKLFADTDAMCGVAPNVRIACCSAGWHPPRVR